MIYFSECRTLTLQRFLSFGAYDNKDTLVCAHACEFRSSVILAITDNFGRFINVLVIFFL